MKKIFTCISGLLIYTTVYAQNPVPNTGFELWTGTNPDLWEYSGGQVSQTSQAHSGLYAISGMVSGSPSNMSMPHVHSTSGGMGFPVTQSYSELTFWFKDYMFGWFPVSVSFTDSAGNCTYADTILGGNTPNFTKVTIPISFTCGTPANCIISFSISGPTAHIGDYFAIDDVSLDNATGIQNPPTSDESIAVYPNPAADYVYIKSTNQNLAGHQFELYDIGGRLVKHNLLNDNSNKVLLDDLKNGVYFYKLISGDKSLAVEKLTIIR